MSISIIEIDFATHDLSSYDAVVNAANDELRPGGGICGAIMARGGPAVAYECGLAAREQRRGVSDCVLTTGGNLGVPVLHAIGPRATGNPAEEHRLLVRTYASIAWRLSVPGFRRILCPIISSGIFGVSEEISIAAAREAFTSLVALHVDLFRKGPAS